MQKWDTKKEPQIEGGAGERLKNRKNQITKANSPVWAESAKNLQQQMIAQTTDFITKCYQFHWIGLCRRVTLYTWAVWAGTPDNKIKWHIDTRYDTQHSETHTQ